MHYVYSLKCKDGFYVGCTNDLRKRMDRYQKGNVPATKNRLPLSLNFYIAFKNKYRTYEFEQYLKSGSGRTFIRRHFV